MKKRVLSLLLACTLLLSAGLQSSAALVSSGQPKGTANGSWEVIPVVNLLSFDQVEPCMLAHNQSLRFLQDALDRADGTTSHSALRTLIREMKACAEELTQMSSGLLCTTLSDLSQALKTAVDELLALEGRLDQLPDLFSSLVRSVLGTIREALSLKVQLEFQIASLNGIIHSMEDLLVVLEKESSSARALKQLQQLMDYIIAAGETLYTTILSTELQLEALYDTQETMDRLLEEMHLRYEMGHISQNTLGQIETGYETLTSSLHMMESLVTIMKGSLQALLGTAITGDLTLEPLPPVTQAQLDAIHYQSDLAAVREKDYALLGSQRTFELVLFSFYTSLAPAMEAVNTAWSTLEDGELDYRAAELKYQQGNISYFDLLDAANTLDALRREVTAAEMKLFNTHHSYSTAVEKGIITLSIDLSSLGGMTGSGTGDQTGGLGSLMGS